MYKGWVIPACCFASLYVSGVEVALIGEAKSVFGVVILH